MSQPAIAINNLEDIKHIIRYRRRWSKKVMLQMLGKATAKLSALRHHGRLTGDEFRTITHNIRVARQETNSGQYQN